MGKYKTWSFQEQLNVGQAGEALVAALVGAVFGHSLELLDVDDGQKDGVDFIVPETKLEVKTETYPARNAYIEYETGGRPSGHAASQADVYVHVFINDGVAYFFNGSELRDFIETRIQEYHYTEQWSSNGGRWKVRGAAVPLSDLEEYVSTVRVSIE